MSLLYPAMLAGLLALGIPLLIHLIARHRYQVQDFPSLRLIRADERTNVFAWRLIDVGQLLLRLVVLLALVAAMARLFAPWPSLGSAPRNLVVVVDASASMRMLAPDSASGRKTPLIELARAKALELLAECGPPGLSALVVAGREGEAPAEPPSRTGSGSAGASPSQDALPSLQPRPDAALRAAETLQAIDGTGGGLVPAIARACALVQGRREVRSQIVVLTDLRAAAFDARNPRDIEQIAATRAALGRSLGLVLVDVASGASDNLAITEAHLRGGEAKVGDDAHVVARVANFGARERSAKLRLAVGQRREPFAKDIAIEPHGSAVVDLTTRVNRAARAFIQVEAEADDPMPHDNTFGLPLHVADVRRVLIVHEAPPSSSPSPSSSILSPSGRADPTPGAGTIDEGGLDGPTILRFALNPGRELGRSEGTGIATTVIAPEALAAQALSKYDVIFLYGISTLPESVLKDLDTFVRQGRALVLIGSSHCNAMRFNRTFATARGSESATAGLSSRAGQTGGSGQADHGTLSPCELGNERALDPPVGIEPLDDPSGAAQEADLRHSVLGIRHSLLEPFRDRLKGDLSVVRFAKVREIRNLAPTASAILSTASGLPLAVEMPAERGRIVLLTFGLELDSSTLARTRVFPALIWRLVDYLTGRLKPTPPDVLVALRPAALDVSEPGFAFARELELLPADGKERGERETRSEGREAGSGIENGKSPIESSRLPDALLSHRLSVGPGETCLVEGLPAGRYVLQKAQQIESGKLPIENSQSPNAARPSSPSPRFGYARLLAVNPDARESDTTRIGEAGLAALFGDGVRVVDITEVGSLSIRGAESWRLLIVLLVLAYAAEGIIGWLRSARREKERAGGQ